MLAGCDQGEARPDSETTRAGQPASVIQSGFEAWLDLGKELAAQGAPADVFIVENHSPRLVLLEGGWFGDPVARTVGGDFLHRSPSGRLRETTVIAGPEGETALLSRVYLSESDLPLLIIRDVEGQLRPPLLTPDPEEDAAAACVEAAVGANDFDKVLDCLGLLDVGGGSVGGGVFAPGWGGFGTPNCDGGGLVMGGSEPGPNSDLVLLWSSHAEQALEGETYGPVNDEFRNAAEDLIAAGEAWLDANVEVAIDPDSDAAQQALLEAGAEFQKATHAFVDAAHELIEENYGPTPGAGEPIPGESSSGDPRCQQQDIDAARGSLFANADFCASKDFLSCLAAEADPIRKITDGKCATVESPLGGKMLKCNDDKGAPLEVQPSEQDGSDPLEWTDPTSPPFHQGKIHTRFVDTLDLGHLMVGLCAADGCPQDPRL